MYLLQSNKLKDLFVCHTYSEDGECKKLDCDDFWLEEFLILYIFLH